MKLPGCPTCQHKGRVTDVEQDHDGYIVRMRVCPEHRAIWATEEVTIHRAAFFARAETHRRRTFATHRRSKRICGYCGTEYLSGSFQAHKETTEHRIYLASSGRRFRCEYCEQLFRPDKAQRRFCSNRCSNLGAPRTLVLAEYA